MVKKYCKCPYCGADHIFDLRYSVEDKELDCTSCSEKVMWKLEFHRYDEATVWLPILVKYERKQNQS